jgi:hypothetical protein
MTAAWKLLRTQTFIAVCRLFSIIYKLQQFVALILQQAGSFSEIISLVLLAAASASLKPRKIQECS